MKSTLLWTATTLSVASLARAQTPLADKHFPYTNLPYQADPDNGERGTQSGYNRCNSTTEGPNSLCQTSLINSVDDFCLWAGQKPGSSYSNVEGETVAWCSKPGHGSRVIPQGALKGVQFMRTPDYVQVIGKIDQTLINIAKDDDGGEMDPHGADFRGNPLGGLVYSNAFPSNHGNNNSFQQVIEWHNFMGGGEFCFKACDPAGKHAAQFCQHIYDRIGCEYNAPADYGDLEGKFVSCEGDNQDFPGVYVENGQTLTYTQPPESLGPINTIPYVARVPKSSNCVTYSSAALYAAAPTQSASSSSASPSATGSASNTASVSGSRTGTLATVTSTARPSSSPSSSTTTSAPTQNAAFRRSTVGGGSNGDLVFPSVVAVMGLILGAGAVFAL